MNKRKKFSKSEKLFIANRANHCCEYCLTPADFTPDPFEIEHIIPLFEGGTNELSNLAFSCSGCNCYKRTKTFAIDPLTQNIIALFNPRIDIWKNHFRWNDVFSLVIPITPQGYATVEFLQLNRIGLINLRKALTKYGVHPQDL
jgi:hypothetical protein